MLRKMIDLLLRTVDQCVIAENVKSMNNVQLNCGVRQFKCIKQFCLKNFLG